VARSIEGKRRPASLLARWLRRIVVLALVLPHPVGAQVGLLQTVPPDKVGLSPERLARVGRFLEAEIASGALPGAVVAVARHGKIAYLESFGFVDPVAGRRMTRDAIFRMHSMTKPWVSVAAMALVEEGRLQLTDPVSRWLPAFKSMKVSVERADPATGAVAYETVPAEREMTVRDLLRHTSGLTYGHSTKNGPVKEAYAREGLASLPPSLMGDSSGDLRTLEPAELVERLARTPLVAQPGTAWEYGLSTDLLGHLLEIVTGRRLSDLLQERVFGPVGMVDSGFWVSKEKAARLAQPLPDLSSGRQKALDVTTRTTSDSGGAGGVSTAMDYLRFAQMLLDRGRLGRARALAPATVALMTTDHLEPGIRVPAVMALGSTGYGFGLGFAVRRGAGGAVLGSAGEFTWGGVSGTLFWVEPREELVGVFLTTLSTTDYGYHRRVVKQLVDAAIE
jgi:CubicO group peptidase (beta-lactamase class C family)